MNQQHMRYLGAPVWQRNYFKHIIRDNTDYNQIAEYILTTREDGKKTN